MFVTTHSMSSGIIYGLQNTVDGPQHLLVYRVEFSSDADSVLTLGKSSSVITGDPVTHSTISIREKNPDSGVSVYDPITTSSAYSLLANYYVKGYTPLPIVFNVPLEIRPGRALLYTADANAFINVFAEEY